MKVWFLNMQSFVLLLVCPCNIFYQSSRYRLLQVIRNIIFSPLYKVQFLVSLFGEIICVLQESVFIGSDCRR